MNLPIVLIFICFIQASFGTPLNNTDFLALNESVPIIEGHDALDYIKKIGKEKVIIDTDAGTDDAVAIFMALASPDLEVLGITTTTGNTNVKQVAVNVLRTLRVIDSKTKVFIGSHKALLETPPSDDYYGKDGFGEYPDPNPPNPNETEKEHAVSAMIRLVRQFPSQVTIIAIGPLTNVALAMRMHAGFKKLVKQIVWIGGSINGVGNVQPGLEFNAYFDPAANFIVFNEAGPPILMVPWELLLYGTKVPLDWRKNILGASKSPQIRFLNQIEQKSIESNTTGTWIAADSKAMAIAMNPGIVKKATFYHVDAVYEGELTKGLMLVDYNKKKQKTPNAIIVEKIDVELYKNMVFQCLAIGKCGPQGKLQDQKKGTFPQNKKHILRPLTRYKKINTTSQLDDDIAMKKNQKHPKTIQEKDFLLKQENVSIAHKEDLPISKQEQIPQPETQDNTSLNEIHPQKKKEDNLPQIPETSRIPKTEEVKEPKQISQIPSKIIQPKQESVPLNETNLQLHGEKNTKAPETSGIEDIPGTEENPQLVKNPIVPSKNEVSLDKIDIQEQNVTKIPETSGTEDIPKSKEENYQLAMDPALPNKDKASSDSISIHENNVTKMQETSGNDTEDAHNREQENSQLGTVFVLPNKKNSSLVPIIIQKQRDKNVTQIPQISGTEGPLGGKQKKPKLAMNLILPNRNKVPFEPISIQEKRGENLTQTPETSATEGLPGSKQVNTSQFGTNLVLRSNEQNATLNQISIQEKKNEVSTNTPKTSETEGVPGGKADNRQPGTNLLLNKNNSMLNQIRSQLRKYRFSTPPSETSGTEGVPVGKPDNRHPGTNLPFNKNNTPLSQVSIQQWNDKYSTPGLETSGNEGVPIGNAEVLHRGMNFVLPLNKNNAPLDHISVQQGKEQISTQPSQTSGIVGISNQKDISSLFGANLGLTTKETDSSNLINIQRKRKREVNSEQEYPVQEFPERIGYRINKKGKSYHKMDKGTHIPHPVYLSTK